MNELVQIITSPDANVRNTPLEAVCGGHTVTDLLRHCDALESFRHESVNLYERVRALLFLAAIHRYHLPPALPVDADGHVPYEGFTHLLQRHYEEAIQTFLQTLKTGGPSETISSALAAAYRGLAFQTLADQVRKSVRSVRGNQWMFRTGHVGDYPLRIRPELTTPTAGVFPVLAETTPVRMDLSHSGWSDIFFLGMDFPEGAKVLNVSIDLGVRSASGSSAPPKPPVEAYVRVIDEPVLRLVSVDLQAQADISSLAEVFNFASDYLGLLKAAVIASGIVPPGLEGSSQPLAALLARLTGKRGHGIEIVSKVNDIPKGSRLAVSTNLLACLISVCMRATKQIETLAGPLQEDDRRLVAARSILGEWLGGSGGGWQDSGGVWPGIKLISGVAAHPGDVEYGISRGCLLPRHRVFAGKDLAPGTRELLQNSLVLVHGGMAQDVGPILEMVTEKYLLRSQKEWAGRLEAIQLLDEILGSVQSGDIRQIASATQRNFDGPIQTIIPWAANYYTSELIRRTRAEFGDGFWGFWMLGGMAGGGMGFIFDPAVKPAAQDRLQSIMQAVKREIESAVPFAIDPVVYDFAINDNGSSAQLLSGHEALLPASYYTLVVPRLLRQEARDLASARRSELEHFGVACQHRPDLAGMASGLIEHLLPRNANEESGASATLDTLLQQYGFDPVQHEKIRADLRAGRIGVAQNALPSSARIEDVSRDQVQDIRQGVPDRFRRLGEEALRSGAVAVVTLAGGIGTRWTKGAGVVKALNPFAKLDGEYRTFAEIHIAKTRRVSRLAGTSVPHIFTTSYMTQAPTEAHFHARNNYGYRGPLYLSPGKSVGLRLIPTTRDLRFVWEEMPQQVLDAQKQKVRDSLRAALIQWAREAGEGGDYRDNVPLQCLHPVGHWYEAPNMLLNGTLSKVLQEHPGVRQLLLHNIDTLGLTVDAGLLGMHMESGATLTSEVIPRVIDDRGGGLAYVDGRVRLIEGLAIPREELEFNLSFYNTGTMWMDIDKLLSAFGLTRADLTDLPRVAQAVRAMAARMPTYVTLKEVKKRWGKGQEDVFPVTQFEKLWGDMTALPEVPSNFVVVPRARGQQLKDVAQLDGWMRDGSAAYVASLCDWA